jgi:VanZ family protein
LKSQRLRIVAVAILLTVAVVIGHLLPGLDTAEIHREVRNALHVIGFALIAAVVFESLSMRAKNAALVTLLIVAALGTLAELAQKFGGNGFDLEDFYRDIAGAALYLCARLVWQWSNAAAGTSAVRFSARFVSIVLGVLLFLPLGYWLSVNARRC